MADGVRAGLEKCGDDLQVISGYCSRELIPFSAMRFTSALCLTNNSTESVLAGTSGPPQRGPTPYISESAQVDEDLQRIVGLS